MKRKPTVHPAPRDHGDRPASLYASKQTLGPRFALLWVVAACLLLAGCAAPTISTTKLRDGVTPAHPGPMRVYKVGQTPQAPFEVIGVVSAHSTYKGDVPWSKGALKKMQRAAAALGADALVGYYANHLSAMTCTFGWSSALAVRTLKPGEQASAATQDYRIAIPHAQVASDVAEGGKAQKLEKWTRELAQYCLTTKGYYAELVDQPLPNAFEQGFAGMTDAELDRYGGPATDRILGVELVGSKGVNVGIGVGAKSSLEAATFRKSKKTRDWSTAASGGMAAAHAIGAAGLADLFAPSAKRIESIENAVENTLREFPAIATATGKK